MLLSIYRFLTGGVAPTPAHPDGEPGQELPRADDGALGAGA
jgi:hypothetical protein